MAVDFEFRRTPAFRIAYLPTMTESQYKESRVRSDFERIARWAREHRCRTGKWLFLHVNKPSDGRFQLAIELKGRARGDRKVRTRRLPASKVGSVVFDPEEISPRVVYFGMSGWLRWERREKKIDRIVSYREVYDGDPWTDRKAWSKTSLEVVVR